MESNKYASLAVKTNIESGCGIYACGWMYYRGVSVGCMGWMNTDEMSIKDVNKWDVNWGCSVWMFKCGCLSNLF
jgi:hypothetical protein